MMNSNRAFVLHGKGDLRLEPRAFPVPQEGEVLLCVEWVGLCGSDVHQWADGRIGAKELTRPFVLGHEASATVLDPNGTELAKGDCALGLPVICRGRGARVAVEPGVSCGRCEACRGGRYNLCPSMRFFSSLQPPTDGILTHFKAHPAALCHKFTLTITLALEEEPTLRLPSTVSLEAGAVVEPLSVAVHAVNRAHIQMGDAVLICGAGPVGILCAMVAKARGAGEITITDLNQYRLDATQKLLPHVRTVNVSSESLVGFVPERVIECTGVGSSQTNALKSCGRGGTVVIVGLTSPSCEFPLADVISKELDVRGVFRYANCHARAIQLLSSGAVDVSQLIMHRFHFEDTARALETAKSGTGLKVLVRCRP